MYASVFRPGYDFEVVNPVVIVIPVYVMDIEVFLKVMFAIDEVKAGWVEPIVVSFDNEAMYLHAPVFVCVRVVGAVFEYVPYRAVALLCVRTFERGVLSPLSPY